MVDSTQAPRVGNQPYNEGDHATQLLADIATLREFRAGIAQKNKGKSPPWTAINLVFESMEGYIKKRRDQPSIKELQTDLHAAEKANETLRKNVTLIKNTLDGLAGGLNLAPIRGSIRTRVQNVKAPTLQHTHAISKNREITVKINDNVEICFAATIALWHCHSIGAPAGPAVNSVWYTRWKLGLRATRALGFVIRTSLRCAAS
jgi:hypothetical protein